MSRYQDVLTGLQLAVVAAYNNANITTPCQVGVGWPNFEDLTEIIQAQEAQISIYNEKGQGGGKNTSRFFPHWNLQTPPPSTLTASITGNVIGFTATGPVSGYNIHTLGGSPLQDSLYQTTGSDTLDSIAANVAANYNAKGIPGSTASANANQVTVIGSPYLFCNVGSSGVFSAESLRVKRDIQIIIWASTEAQRYIIEDAIISQVGNSIYPRFYLTDGSFVWCRYQSNWWDDQDVLDFSMFTSHLFYEVEYVELATAPATQIGAFVITTNNGHVTLTQTEG